MILGCTFFFFFPVSRTDDYPFFHRNIQAVRKFSCMPNCAVCLDLILFAFIGKTAIYFSLKIFFIFPSVCRDKLGFGSPIQCQILVSAISFMFCGVLLFAAWKPCLAVSMCMGQLVQKWVCQSLADNMMI